MSSRSNSEHSQDSDEGVLKRKRTDSEQLNIIIPKKVFRFDESKNDSNDSFHSCISHFNDSSETIYYSMEDDDMEIQEESLICPICGIVFEDSYQRQMHECMMHEQEEEEEEEFDGSSTDNNYTRNKKVEPPKTHLLSLPVDDGAGFVEYETSFNQRLKSFFIRDDMGHDLPNFLNYIQTKVQNKINEMLHQFQSVKINMVVDCTMRNMVNEEMDASFKTSNEAVYEASDISEIINRHFGKLSTELDESQLKKSGWFLSHVDGLRLKINKNNPLRSGSYLPLPEVIARKNACINVKNKDDQCFKYAILAKLIEINPQNVSKYKNVNHRYNFNNITFPTPLHEIKRFSKDNAISINVFGLNKENNVFPILVCDNELPDHRDLLLLKTDTGINHYCYIKHFSRLVSNQLSKTNNKKMICKRCFTHYDQRYNGQTKFEEHKRLCQRNSPARIEFPQKQYLEFSNIERMKKIPFVVYCDFEAILSPTNFQNKNSNSDTKFLNKHTPMSFAIYVVKTDDVEGLTLSSFDTPYLYRGENAAKHCIECLKKVANEVCTMYKRNRSMLPLTNDENLEFENAEICYMCEEPFVIIGEVSDKVHDHCHYTGQYRGAAHRHCNLHYSDPKFLPVFIHNLSGYDSHFLINELSYDEKRIDIIPHSEEKYITFSKFINDSFSIRFIDTIKFMPSSLDSLAQNLPHFHHTGKFFAKEELELVTRKGVFPYEYVDSWNKLHETCLPPKEKFHSKLRDNDISEEDYKFAQKVWTKFGCQTLGDYSDHYLKTDVLLLSDIFENFRSSILASHKLDPAHYFTLPGLSWDAMLKFSKVKLEIIKDYDMIMLIENGIRGGLCQVSHRFSQANNIGLKVFDSEKDESFITYLDCNNLYGLAMTSSLPLSNFTWVKNPNSIPFQVLSENSEFGYFLEVDVEYPDSLHQLHNDLPFLPERKAINRGPKKLIADLGPKQKYVVHYLALQQAVKHGLKVIQIHRAIQFKQSKWMVSYIHLNNELRKKSTSKFDQDLFKLFNNAIFGKTMENVRKRRDMKLVSGTRPIEKYIARSDFKDRTIYNENLALVHLHKSKLKFDKPIYVGLAVLDLSKVTMYQFHYDVMVPKFGPERIKLLYTDTDSFIYELKTNDLYEELSSIIDYLDTSDLPINHKCFSMKNKKVLGKFKDETKGTLISAFVGLRAKMYSIKYDNGIEIKKSKGVGKVSVQTQICFQDYMDVLFNQTILRTNVCTIESKQHQVYTIERYKKSLSANDDKRIVGDDGVSTFAHGSYFSVDEF